MGHPPNYTCMLNVLAHLQRFAVQPAVGKKLKMEEQGFIGETLGERRKHYNKLVKEAIAGRKLFDSPNIVTNECDINNLLKIDVAANRRDVDFILNTLRCEDLLYVSRAIKQCTWLITDEQYGHIINPDYLHTQLFPQMTTKAIIKLILEIRLKLKDEKRVEGFYNYYEENHINNASKWLPNCSVAFIETAIKKHTDIDAALFTRLCKKSISIFESLLRNTEWTWSYSPLIEKTKFLLYTNTKTYLEALASLPQDTWPKFGVKGTSIIMKLCPDIITENFEKYISAIDVPTFAKHLNKDDIKNFLLSVAEKNNLEHWLTLKNIRQFIIQMPRKIKFGFVKDVFIDKIHEVGDNIPFKDPEMLRMSSLYYKIICSSRRTTEIYYWYQYAAFNEAFDKITQLIHNEQDIHKRESMLSILLQNTELNMQNIQTLLSYYLEKYNKFPSNSTFLNDLLTRNNISKFDVKTWNILNSVFETMNVYSDEVEKTGGESVFVESIIIYKILHNEEVPNVIEKQFNFNTLKTYKRKVNESDGTKIFNYLYNLLTKRLAEKNISTKPELENAIIILRNLFELLKDYEKNIIDYPITLVNLREFMKVSKENSWKVDLSQFYNFKKSWRKYMFEESLAIYPTKDACINALKHDPKILKRYENELEVLRFHDSFSLKPLLNKLRIYWPDSLAKEWTETYQKRLHKIEGQKAVIRSLCILLPRNQVQEIIKEYVPIEAKIDWSNVDELRLGLQRNIATNMHFSRPQPHPDTVLWYAKGDYLQYALPSVHSIYYNLSYVNAREPIMKLLNSQVSLQKHGVRFSFTKLKSDELSDIFSEIWKSTKNATIRAVTFKFTFNVLCKEKDKKRIQVFWKLLESYIDNLSFNEDKAVYDFLNEIERVPDCVRSSFCVKSYNFLKTLLQHRKQHQENDFEINKIKWNITQLAKYTRELMESIDTDFVAEILLEYVNNEYVQNNDQFYTCYGMLKVMSSYLLCVEDENSQMMRYEKIFLPLMKKSISLWKENYDENKYIKRKFQDLLNFLFEDLKIYVDKKKIVPVQLFSNIQKYIEESLPVPQNYMMLTKWKFTVTLTNLISQHYKDIKDDITVEKLCRQSSKEFGKECLFFLKEDTKLYFPCIYVLFSRCLRDFTSSLCIENFMDDVCTAIISDNDFVQGYLTAITIISEDQNQTSENIKNIRKTIYNHSSVEIKMHYYYNFRREIWIEDSEEPDN